MKRIISGFVGSLLLGATTLSLGQVVNLADNLSTASINAGSGGDGYFGLNNWRITPDGPNWVVQQVYAVSINGGPVDVFNNLATASVSQPVSSMADISYAISGGYDFKFRYVLTGGQPNSADLAEITSFVNRSGKAVSFSLFEYDFFSPGGQTGGTGTLLNSSTINHSNGLGSVTVGAVGIPSRYMIGKTNDVAGALLGGNLTNTSPSFSDPEDLAFAFQWNVTVDPNRSWQMSKDKLIEAVPEPASMLALGGLALVAIRRRRAK